MSYQRYLMKVSENHKYFKKLCPRRAPASLYCVPLGGGLNRTGLRGSIPADKHKTGPLRNEPVLCVCPRRESNPHFILRTDLFYPLNYEGDLKAPCNGHLHRLYCLGYCCKFHESFIEWNNYQGPLAHLVERFHGMEEATGSNPVWSTP